MMNQQEILRKIGRIIQELQDQQLYLSQTSNINLLELELFTANADFLIDHIEILKKLNHQDDVLRLETNPSVELEIIPEKPELEELSVIEEEVLAEEVQEKIIKEEPIEKPFFDFSFEEEPTEMVFDFEKKVPVEEVFDRALSSEEIEVLESKAKALEELDDVAVEQEIINEEEEGPEPFLMVKETELVEELEVVEKEIEIIEPEIPVKEKPAKSEAKEPKLTLNEMLSAQKDQKQSAIKTGKSKLDLKITISLNDKMVFIKELFNGYNLAYSEAVEIINRFESFEAADNFLLKNYAQKNNWSNKQETVDRFYEYLNRKFGA